MLGKGSHIFLAIIAIAMTGLIVSMVQSDDSTVAVPTVPKAEGGSCVAPPEDMRKNHMQYLKHDRDLSVQDGVKKIDASLKDCVACHVVKDDAGEPVSVESPKHFCRSCHDYAAVNVDCFSCHNSKPDEKAVLTATNPHQKTDTPDPLEQDWSSDFVKDGAHD